MSYVSISVFQMACRYVFSASSKAMSAEDSLSRLGWVPVQTYWSSDTGGSAGGPIAGCGGGYGAAGGITFGSRVSIVRVFRFLSFTGF